MSNETATGISNHEADSMPLESSTKLNGLGPIEEAEGDKTPTEPAVGLKRQLSLLHAVSILVGCVIGSGIFISPVGVMQNAGSVGAALIIWFVVGVFLGLGALCYAEFGSIVTTSGGDYAYLLRAFGAPLAFVALWILFLLGAAAGGAVVALAFATYVLRPIYPDVTCPPPSAVTRLLAACLLTLLAAINCYNVRWVARVQVFFTATKLLALALIVIFGLISIGKGNTHNFVNSFENTNSAGSIAIAVYSCFWAYSGWNFLNFVVEELQNPKRNLPLAVLISMSIIIFVYVLTNVAYLSVLTPEEMIASPAVAVTFAERTMGPAAFLMPLLVASSIFGSANGGFLVMSRLFYIASRKGHFPKFISMISIQHSTPAPSIILMCVAGLCMLTSDDMFVLIGMLGFGNAIIYTMVFAALIYMRWKRADIKRIIKMPIAVIAMEIGLCLLIVVLTFYQQFYETLLAAGVIAISAPLYLFGVVWNPKPRFVRSISHRITSLLQKIFVVVPEDLDEEHLE